MWEPPLGWDPRLPKKPTASWAPTFPLSTSWVQCDHLPHTPNHHVVPTHAGFFSNVANQILSLRLLLSGYFIVEITKAAIQSGKVDWSQQWGLSATPASVRGSPPQSKRRQGRHVHVWQLGMMLIVSNTGF